MLKLNKYLRELGYSEESWPFNEIAANVAKKEKGEEFDKAYIEGAKEEGFTSCEFYSLDVTLNMEIYSRLCYFREHCLVGVPDFMIARYDGDSDKAFKKWAEYIDIMIEGYKLKLTEQTPRWDVPDKERRLISKNRQKKINYAMRLFVKYSDCLWY